MLRRLQRSVAVALCAALLLTIPGPQAYAAVREVAVPEVPPARLSLGIGPTLTGASSVAGDSLVAPASPLKSVPGIGLGAAAAGAGAPAAPMTGAAAAPLSVAAPAAAPEPAVSATPSAPNVGTPAAPAVRARSTALPQARQASSVAAAALQQPGASADSLRASASAAFDAVRPQPVADAVEEPLVAAWQPMAALAPAEVAAPRAGRAVPALASARALLRRAASAASARPVVTKILALAAVAAAALVLPHVVAAVSIPVVLGTCNSMRERALKDATILPQNQTQQDVAKKELDRILVEFGKRLKQQADQDSRVTTEISAHSAEHGMEEPILEVLPELKGLWAAGADISKEQALEKLRGAVLEELRRRFPNESAEVVEELLEKTGSWKELLDWESRHQVLDSLKKAAKEKPQETLEQLQKIREQGEVGQAQATSHGHSHGTFLLGLGLLAGAALLHLAVGPVAVAPVAAMMLLAGTLKDAAPPQPPVDLDTYLASLGLSKDDADFLKEFTIDIGARDMAPIIGRSKELRRAITILSKPAGTQNNPMILGDKGVGKTAIVEGIARYLYQNRLPSLKGKRILELDAGKLAAGTGVVGKMEERLTKLRGVLTKTDNKVILFVDEIHTILKNTATSNSVPDLLKSPLRNGEITVIGATTVGEYRKYVEQDPAFADRFDTIQVNEPSEDEAIEMLEGDLEYLEKKFDVQIDPEAARAAVKLSARYMPEKYLPRKARQLLESAIADAKPEAARDGLQVQIDQLTDRLRLMVKRYAELRKAEDPARKGDEIAAYNRVVALYTTILSLEDQRGAVVEERIGKEQVLRTLAKETGIPVGDMGEDEYKRLLRMEPWFKERIVGQDDAIKALADTVRTNKAGLSDPNRPQGVFLFAGKTGVGKTALARSLAEFLFSDPDAVIRLDMSEYMEKFAVQRMFGAPPGYVGYDSGGELTEKVRRRPYSVVLIDEIEKAHPDVLNALLQVFDAGRMTDGKQNTVNFKNTIIIMTTNLGAASTATGDAFRADVMDVIRQRLRPEFVNRIDKTVVFNPIDVQQAEAITSIMVKDVQKRLREQDLELRVSPEALQLLARKGFDPDYGARPLKRVVENDVTNALSPFLLAKKAEGALAHGGVVEVTARDGQIAFDLKPNPPPTLELAPLPPGPLGDKLRRILEQAVSGSGVAKDMESFESALFPDRKAVTLDKPLGRFWAEASPAVRPDAQSSPLSAAVPGVKDPALAALKAQLAESWPSRPDVEAAAAWLDAFSRAAKALSPRRPPTARVSVADGGDVTLVLEAEADAGYAARQKLARKALEHFSQELPDEAAVRARAAALKDEGREADLDWLEAKRLVEAVPGATFGWKSDEADGGSWKFWLRLPGAAKASSPAPGAAAEAPGAPADAPPQAPIAALEARLSPARMFLFLTQRGPAAMEPRRALVADLLDSKSTQVRLLGLHMAAALLSPSDWREVAATVRMLRLSDAKDYALFSALAQAHPNVPMTGQRQALLDTYESTLRTMRGYSGRTRYGIENTAREARYYGKLSVPVLGTADAAESRKAFSLSDKYRTRFRKVASIFAAATLPVLAGVAFAAHHWAWGLGWEIALPLVLGGISFWILMGNYNDLRREGPRDAALYQAAIMPRLAPPERLEVTRELLDEASRGRLSYLTGAEAAALLGPSLEELPEGEKAKLFRRWRESLDAALARLAVKPSSREQQIVSSIGLLSLLLPRVPEGEREACAKTVLTPLRARWLPERADDYLAGLGAWLKDAPLSEPELDELLGVIVNFPNSNQARLSAFMPVYEGIASRKGLSLTARAALDQTFVALSAEAGSRREQAETVDLARLRVKLGAVRDVWPSLQELFVGQNASYLPFRSLLRLAVEAPPSQAEAAKMLAALDAFTGGRYPQDQAYEKLFRARLTGREQDRLDAALGALRDMPVDNDPVRPALDPALLDDLARLTAAPLSDAAVRAAWEAAVRENAERLEEPR